MAIRMTTTSNQIDTYLIAEMERAHNLTIRALMCLGEECVIEARDRPGDVSWIDQTGNLRSSIGYVIVYNGQVVYTSSFEQVKQGADGVREGKELALKLAKEYNQDYALIVVAGMNYAIYVEAIDNKVVLTSAETLARKKLPQMIEKLKTQIAK